MTQKSRAMSSKKASKLTKVATLNLKGILKRCASLIRKQGVIKEDGLPGDVPEGHFAVYVGEKMSRFIIPISMLAHAGFQNLLQAAEEEYDFHHDMGGLRIPCEETIFTSLTSMLC
ncbi:hypothetical protein KSP39_PZI020722 [Platanthera zijinensis]|uniref:Small auxin up regulated protein n=1 Tax=Platanthera zijinensis TaxID=2320716 RepID=A0AAP0B1H0_9ASPA